MALAGWYLMFEFETQLLEKSLEIYNLNAMTKRYNFLNERMKELNVRVTSSHHTFTIGTWILVIQLGDKSISF